MKNIYVRASICALCVLAAISLNTTIVFAEPPEAGTAIKKPGPDDRCPVCGMFPFKNPKWAAGFLFQDGFACVHCSPKCMLHNLHNISKYQPARKREDIKRIWVTEYYSTTQMDADQVLFVTGASLTGPMGLDIVPVKDRDAAENFMRDYQGKQMLRLDEVTEEIVEQARKNKKKHQ